MNFDDALEEATRLAKARLTELQEDVILVRDLHGRIRVLLDSANPESKPSEPFKKAFKSALKALAQSMAANLGVYAYPKKDIFLFREDLPSLALPDAASSTIRGEEGGFKVCLHDRLLTGTQWNAHPVAESDNPKRFTLFSMKGGVGRSTTAIILAWHLAKRGKRVLVFDLDLESPGVGTTLLGSALPRFGIVDWFVEDALGQGDHILDEMVVESPLSEVLDGRIAVVPAFGSDTGDYLAKLGRTYFERGPRGYEAWPDRLKRLVDAVEGKESPDVVLLDSRTGLHDTSAALVLAMGANTLLFAVDTEQTWTAYRFLFRHWRGHPNRHDFRDKLWVVGAMIPDTQTRDYLDSLRDHAWALFDDELYDPAGATPDPDAFTYGFDDEAGRHYPREVFWQRSLLAFDPLQTWTDQFVTAAYQSFLNWFDKVLLGETENS